MAQITEVKLLDDLDGGEAAESVSFSLDGKSYEIDLSEKHAAALRDAFAPFVSTANGLEVSARGRISSTVLEAYENRGNAVAAPEPVAEQVAEAAPEAPAKPKRRSRKKVTAEA